jgi:hypothetical protein
MRVLDEDPELQALIEKIGVLSPRRVGIVDDVGQTKVNERIKLGEERGGYDSFLDGSARKIPIASILRRRQRLLAEAAKPVRKRPLLQPGESPQKRAEARDRAEAAAAARSAPKLKSPPQRRRQSDKTDRPATADADA